MTEYRSIHKGKTIDDTIQQVIDHDAIVKWGNIEGSLSNQVDLFTELGKKVPKTLTINGKALSHNIVLDFDDVNALPNTTRLAKSINIENLTVSLLDQDDNVMSEDTIPTYNQEEIETKLAERANIDLSNLSNEGENHFANLSLSDLDYAGKARFANPDLDNLSGLGELKFRKSPALAIIKGNLDSMGNLDLIDGELYSANYRTLSEPGSYSWTAPTTANYSIRMVGGGGGGAANNTDGARGVNPSAGSAGSGAYWQGQISLIEGDVVTVVVGAGGKLTNSQIYSYGTRGKNGGDTVLKINGNEVVRCGGGTGGWCGGPAPGGQVTITHSSYIVIGSSTIKNGYSGYREVSQYAFWVPVIPNTKTPYDETETGPGAGGGCKGTAGRYAQNGVPGLFQSTLEIEGAKEIQYKVSSSNPLIIADEFSNKYKYESISGDIVNELGNGTYNKFIGTEGPDLLNGLIFKGLETPKYYETVGNSVLVSSLFVASGFTANSFLRFNKVFPFSTATSWSLYTRFRFQSSESTQTLLSESVDAPGLYSSIFITGNKVGWTLTSTGTGTTPDIANNVLGTREMVENNIYDIKIERTESTYNLYLKEESETWAEVEPEITVSSASNLRDLVWNIGYEFGSEIHLTHTIAYVDDLEFQRLTPNENDVWIQGPNTDEDILFEERSYPVLAQTSHTFTISGNHVAQFHEEDVITAEFDGGSDQFAVTGIEYVTDYDRTILTVRQEISSEREYTVIVPSKEGTPSISVFRYTGSTWATYNKVYIGSITIKNNHLISIKNTYLYNNSFDILGGQTRRFVVDSYRSGYSWYMLYNDGWLIQGGTCLATVAGSAMTVATIRLLKNYRDSAYQAIKCNRWYSGANFDSKVYNIWNRTAGTFDVGITVGSGTTNLPQGGSTGFDWMTMGWAE